MNRELYARLGRQSRGPDERLLTRELNMPLKGPVLLVAGCQDNQESGDGIGNGRFTQELLRVWDEGRFQGDWKTLAERIVSNMPPSRPAPHPDRAGTGNAGSAGAVLHLRWV
jgi:hypothetical protein